MLQCITFRTQYFCLFFLDYNFIWILTFNFADTSHYANYSKLDTFLFLYILRHILWEVSTKFNFKS